MPEALAEELGQGLNLTDAQDLCKGCVDGGRVSLHPKGAGGLLQNFPIKHKICACHTHMLPRAVAEDPGYAAGRLLSAASRCVSVVPVFGKDLWQLEQGMARPGRGPVGSGKRKQLNFSTLFAESVVFYLEYPLFGES